MTAVGEAASPAPAGPTAQRPKFGFGFWNVPMHQRIELAVLGEELGYDLVTIGEHIVVPMAYESSVPNYSSDPKRAKEKVQLIDSNSLLYDQFTVAGAIFAKTSRISIMTSVHLLAMRHPLLTALPVRTLHELSEGRFMLGVAGGWNKEEFDAIGVPFEERGRRLDEGIEVLKAAMKGGPFEYSGKHFAFRPLQVSATPFEVPIIIGGNAPPALRRAARVGDGYFASGESNVEVLLGRKAKIDAMRKELGTDTKPFQHWLKVTTTDPDVIEGLVAQGHDRFVLYGDGLWALEHHSFEDRCERLRTVAASLGIKPPSAN